MIKSYTIIQRTYPTPKHLSTTNFIHSIVGREKELKGINSKLTEMGSLLIHRLGGLGKSTLASYYLYTQKENYDYYGFFDSLEDFISALKTALHLKQTNLEKPS